MGIDNNPTCKSIIIYCKTIKKYCISEKQVIFYTHKDKINWRICKVMNTKLNVLLKRLLDFSFYVGCVMEVTAYFWIRPGIDLLEKYFPNTNEFSQIKVQYVSSILIIMGTGLFALAILYELRKMMKTVIEEDCFVQQNVKPAEEEDLYVPGISYRIDPGNYKVW